MNVSPEVVQKCASAPVESRRPRFQYSDIWKAPLHDFPIREELVYQYLPLSAEDSVLEVGPGAGSMAFRLARLVRRLTLVDVSQDNVANLKESLGSFCNLSFLSADASTPEFPAVVGAGFDALVAIEVFACVPDPAACMKNFAAVLRPSGRLLLQWPNYDAGPLRKGPATSFTRAEIDAMLRHAGFRDWRLYALKLRPHADWLYSTFHERPLRAYRRLRAGNQSKSLAYDQTWVFQSRRSLEPYKPVLHFSWALLLGMMRLGGDCFMRTFLGQDIRNRNLLLIADR